MGARADYALAWFNLGVLYDRMGPGHVLASQGALARAFALDSSLRERKRQLTIDARVYRSGLDLSKPLPPRWSFAGVQRLTPAASAGLLAVLIVAVGLARGAAQGGSREIATSWLEPVSARFQRLPGIGRVRSPAWAVGATVIVFLLPQFRNAVGRVTEMVTFGLGVLLIAACVVGARVVMASRAGVVATHQSWGPGILFGIGTGAAGMPWAPLPAVEVAEDNRRVHRAAPAMLAVLGLVLFLEAVIFHLPLTRSLAVAVLIMAASVLVPVHPMDGKVLAKEGALLGAGIVGASALLILGIV